MQSFPILTLFAIVLVARRAEAGSLNLGSLMGDVSQVAVAGEKNAITSLRVENDYVQPEATNLLGDVLGGVGTGLGDLANAITSLSLQMKTGPQGRSLSSDSASIVAEGGAVSAKTIAAAADAAAPYIRQIMLA
ncbi:uncharacterized protein LOC108025145 isoform X3 [Drosophila biarmipes]|uniref:uncharacterized protein LOC108025145 isoform X3 n=1 Tax=Drosophila biarmipes TaxID=125945 RepID=UPI0007E61611|nr:uncharacterized protein LOC108025145 isoform X3 [Drosophila biarmipes]